jgi:hypothetical protein
MQSGPGEDEIFRFRLDMFRDIRMELDQLKTCQSNAIIWGVAAATTIISILNISSSVSTLYPFLLLIPLIVIFPAWIIFFDKSRTISRLTAFLRLQEKLAMLKSTECVYGWETALEKYWAGHDVFKEGKTSRRTMEALLKKIPENRQRISSHVYWGTAYLVFLLLSVVSLLLTVLFIGQVELLIFIPIAILHLYLDFRSNIGNENLSFLSWLPDNSFREILDFVTQYLKEYLFVQGCAIIIFLVWLTRVYSNPDLMRILGNTVLFILFLGFFIFIAFSTFYIFINLIRGRYAISFYESRWMIILGASSDLKQQVAQFVETVSPSDSSQDHEMNDFQ